MVRRPSPEMTILAANLKAHRKARGLTRKEVEEATGISAKVLEQYENRPGLDAYLLPIITLARFYDTTCENLITEPDPSIPSPVKRKRRSSRA